MISFLRRQTIMPPFDRKVVLVTGGGTGIGRAAAIAFGRSGANVIVSGRRRGPCDETVQQLRSENPNCDCLAVPADVGCEADVERLFSLIETRFGRLDGAFFNAGTGGAGHLVDQSPQEFERIMRVNCHGLWLCLRSSLRMMIAQKSGSIVNNLSVHSSRTIFQGTAAYTASKHAALALTKAAAVEGAGYGVRVNGVAPGPIMTEMLVNSADIVGGIDGWAQRVPQRRVGTPEEVAAAVLWLAGGEASFVNGAVLSVDGAFLAT